MQSCRCRNVCRTVVAHPGHVIATGILGFVLAMCLLIEGWFGFGVAAWYVTTYHTVDPPPIGWFAFGAAGPTVVATAAALSRRRNRTLFERVIRVEVAGLVVAGLIAMAVVVYLIYLVAAGG